LATNNLHYKYSATFVLPCTMWDMCGFSSPLEL
jgi:hypothetical protein